MPVADVAATTMGFDTHLGEAMAMGERTPLAVLNAAASARMAVGEALTNLAAATVEKLGDVKLSANWMAAAGSPGEDVRLYEAVKAVGVELCPALGIAIPVGKDSMSMRTTWDGKIVTAPLSLIVSAFAPVRDVRKTLTPELQPEGALVLIDLGNGKNRLGGSALAQVFNETGEVTPDVDSPKHRKCLCIIKCASYINMIKCFCTSACQSGSYRIGRVKLNCSTSIIKCCWCASTCYSEYSCNTHDC